MEFSTFTLGLALVAGTLSFLSPCVFPLLPAYLSYITGQSTVDVQTSGNSQVMLLRSVAFALGLTLALTILGASASMAGQWLLQYQNILVRIGGLVVIIFGLHMAGWLRIPTLYREQRINWGRFSGRGVGGAFLMGSCFGIGWTPCIGPMLGAILLIASQEQTLWQGMTLLTAYGLGLGLPFILAAVALERMLGFSDWVHRHAGRISVFSGLLLIAMGMLLATDQLAQMAIWLQRVLGPGLIL